MHVLSDPGECDPKKRFTQRKIKARFNFARLRTIQKIWRDPVYQLFLASTHPPTRLSDHISHLEWTQQKDIRSHQENQTAPIIRITVQERRRWVTGRSRKQTAVANKTLTSWSSPKECRQRGASHQVSNWDLTRDCIMGMVSTLRREMLNHRVR